MVENFGSYLKHERELRGVPLEEISGATKIHIRFLKALEENSFDQLPGEVFIKGYIRSYADIIGSDVEEMLNIYKESMEFKNQENIPAQIPSTKPKTFLIFGLLILLIVGLFFGVGSLMKKADDPEKEKASSVQKQIAIPEPSMSPVISESQVVKEENVDVVDDQELTKPETTELSLPNPIAEGPDEEEILSPEELIEPEAQTPSVSLADLGPQNPEDMDKALKLTIRANENSWFNMTIDGFREEDFILPAGTAKTFWGNEGFRLTVGNKPGVELLLNGKVLTLPESKDRVVKDFIINSKLVE